MNKSGPTGPRGATGSIYPYDTSGGLPPGPQGVVGPVEPSRPTGSQGGATGARGVTGPFVPPRTCTECGTEYYGLHPKSTGPVKDGDAPTPETCTRGMVERIMES